jgi:zinc transport system substrate-binding protein
MVLGPAQPVAALGVVVAQRVDDAAVDEHGESPVDGREPDALPLPAQAGVQLLGGGVVPLAHQFRKYPDALRGRTDASLGQPLHGLLFELSRRHAAGSLAAMRMRIILILIACSLIPAGCAASDESGGNGRARTSVVAAFYPLAWAAERIGGPSVQVTNLTPPGAEPHDVELSARDVERVRSADVVLYLGAGFQPALERAVESAEGRTVDLLAGQKLRAGGEEGGQDPHVWLDPIRYASVVERIGAALDRPAAAARLVGKLRALDRDYRAGLARCERRELVTSHAAFGYLAARYRLEQIAITGISPEVEPSARDLERVVRKVREHHATTVFFETLVSPRLARTVAREADARVAVLNPIEGLSKEELRDGEDYLSVMRANLAALREALGCR